MKNSNEKNQTNAEKKLIVEETTTETIEKKDKEENKEKGAN